ncbi:hypothetical protein [Proteiniborus sp. MB09-C3]|uniref:hypothetical protein n=1 Tax=Proteiniborus sp. MB09-C3 TaxID=3050072 RepID=UPI0025540ED2|nr:hypothetical protein [Proteiniborus sp. MB09-C3]WIV11087.1 hypothetical protein QO263_13120 [Proteiniborus sp. MB09-C3]
MDKYKKTINKCELYAIEEKYRDATAHAIKLLFLDIEKNRRINIGDNIIPAEIVEEDMEKLDFFVIEHAVNKFKEASREKKIRNTVAYLKVCIYNSIHDIKLDIDADIRYKGFTM